MKRVWDIDELIEYFTLTPDILALIKDKSKYNKLGFSVLLKFFQTEGRFPNSKTEIPASAIAFISKQLKINKKIFKKYSLDSRLCRYHMAQIKDLLSFKELTSEDAEKITKWLYENIECYDRGKVNDILHSRLRELKFEPPTPDRIDRIISSALRNYEAAVFNDIASSIPMKTKVLIDEHVKMFSEDENNNTVEGSVSFNELRSDPGRIGLDSVFQEVKKLRMLRNLQVPLHLLDKLPQKVLKKYKQRVSSELLSEIRRHPDHVRYSLLSIFFWVRSREITDNLADLLISIIHKIQVKSERKVDREILNDVKKVSGKYNILRNLAEISLENPDKTIEDVVYPVYSKKLLEDLVKDLNMNDNSYRCKVYSLMKNSYSRHYRRMIPELFDVLEFRSNNEIHKPVLDALKMVKKLMASNVKTILVSSIPILGVIKPKWRRAVIQSDCNGNEFIERVNYEICVLQSLREKLRCKEIWIEGADRYRNSEEDLPKDFENRREEYYEALKQPNSAEVFIENLKNELSQALHSLNDSVLNNPKIKLTNIKGGRITVSPSEPQSEPLNLTALKSGLMEEWPMVNLLDILKETDYLLNFTEHFKSAGVRESLDRETIRKRLIVSLFALGTNTGLKRIAKASEQ